MNNRNKKQKARALVGWNTGQRVHAQAKGAGVSARRERRKSKLDLKNAAKFLNE